jgi:TonB-dependent SusC/RagA subfamily outer membrane receptor
MKNPITFILFVVSMVLCTPGMLKGQNRLIQGQITTFDTIPVMHAEIKVASTNNVYYSDSLGFFQAFGNDVDRITVNARGFSKQRVKLNERNKFVFVNMKLKKGEYNQELAIGYGHINPYDKSFAIATQTDRDFNYSGFPTLAEAIIGRFPGVAVRNNEVIIRGNESFSASNAALIVIDGIARGTSIAGIAPYNVKSITMLKDASAAAYGSQGANGVVLIETRRGGQSNN